jgi:hypothetical protein
MWKGCHWRRETPRNSRQRPFESRSPYTTRYHCRRIESHQIENVRQFFCFFFKIFDSRKRPFEICSPYTTRYHCRRIESHQIENVRQFFCFFFKNLDSRQRPFGSRSMYCIHTWCLKGHPICYWQCLIIQINKR